jgi:alkanesulfonate monooxygenase
VLWTGLVRSHGAPAIALVGSADEIADALIDFKRAGASQFILSGWPRMQSMKFFGEDVLPRVRRLEKPHGSGMTRVTSGDPRADRRR